LFQEYLYHALSAGERRLLHGEIAVALEELYRDRADEIEVEAKICVSLSGRAADLEFLGGPHTGAKGDMMAVRARLLNLAEEGYFSSLGYKREPTDELIKEMDALVERCIEKARRMLREHADKVEALVDELLEKEELGAEEVTAILGKRPPA
jgi:cell division protease FtsH